MSDVKMTFTLTWNVSVAILKGMKVIHEFFHRDLEGLKQPGVFKEPVGDLKLIKVIVREQGHTNGEFFPINMHAKKGGLKETVRFLWRRVKSLKVCFNKLLT